MSSPLAPLDLYYLAVSSNLFRYGYLVILIIGFVGNTCQIVTFSRKTMRNVSTGVLFLALSISDMAYLLFSVYILYIYGFQQIDRSNMNISCRIRHFSSNFSMNLSAWILTAISCDRWIRSQFPYKAQQICTPRHALYMIMMAGMIDALLHVHFLTPFFGPIVAGPGGSCSANVLSPTYLHFFKSFWPTISIMTSILLPSIAMLLFLSGTIININSRRTRIAPIQSIHANGRDTHRSRFIHRQMFILMIATLILFFVTCLPASLYRFTVATLNVQQSFTLSLLLTAAFGVIQAANYSLNFYLHCLTSKLFRKEFFQPFRCQKRSIRPNTLQASQQRFANPTKDKSKAPM